MNTPLPTAPPELTRFFHRRCDGFPLLIDGLRQSVASCVPAYADSAPVSLLRQALGSKADTTRVTGVIDDADH